MEVPTLYGKVMMNVPSGTQSSKMFRLRGKGLPRPDGYGKGDQLVRIHVWVPTKLSKNEKDLLNQLATMEDITPPKQ